MEWRKSSFSCPGCRSQKTIFMRAGQVKEYTCFDCNKLFLDPEKYADHVLQCNPWRDINEIQKKRRAEAESFFAAERSMKRRLSRLSRKISRSEHKVKKLKDAHEIWSRVLEAETTQIELCQEKRVFKSSNSDYTFFVYISSSKTVTVECAGFKPKQSFTLAGLIINSYNKIKVYTCKFKPNKKRVDLNIIAEDETVRINGAIFS